MDGLLLRSRNQTFIQTIITISELRKLPFTFITIGILYFRNKCRRGWRPKQNKIVFYVYSLTQRGVPDRDFMVFLTSLCPHRPQFPLLLPCCHPKCPGRWYRSSPPWYFSLFPGHSLFHWEWELLFSLNRSSGKWGQSGHRQFHSPIKLSFWWDTDFLLALLVGKKCLNFPSFSWLRYLLILI